MFITHEVAIELIRALRTLVPIIEAQDRDLGDQIRRAASSITLNLGEGQRLTKGNKLKHYVIAHGSANEVKSALRTAQAWGWIDDASASAALAILDRLLALCWRLTHPKPPGGLDERQQ